MSRVDGCFRACALALSLERSLLALDLGCGCFHARELSLGFGQFALGLGRGGDTPLCPFDCQCCF